MEASFRGEGMGTAFKGDEVGTVLTGEGVEASFRGEGTGTAFTGEGAGTAFMGEGTGTALRREWAGTVFREEGTGTVCFCCAVASSRIPASSECIEGPCVGLAFLLGRLLAAVGFALAALARVARRGLVSVMAGCWGEEEEEGGGLGLVYARPALLAKVS